MPINMTIKIGVPIENKPRNTNAPYTDNMLSLFLNINNQTDETNHGRLSACNIAFQMLCCCNA